MQAAWPNVRADLQRGIPPMPTEIAALEVALASGNVDALRAAPWTALEVSANNGIAARDLHPAVADALRERLRNFGEALVTYAKQD